MSTSGGAKAAYHHGDLRRSLLAAARALLDRGGPDAVTLREAARAAGVSHNAPYRHFPSRDALLAAVATEGFLALRARLAAAREAAPPAGRLVAIGRAYLGFAAQERAAFRLMFGGALDLAAHAELREAAEAAFTVLRDTVAEGADAASVEGATVRAWGLVHGLATLVADRQITPEAAEAGLA
ncbi:TetR/AcrR family transcriptional regulator [Methylobacterium oryzisoli]|uniref:TetR/AcrR family transcriptional regulator n=1 Tax=Methylobacterium oryzisoli TaxID=3385502 RepID=UPI0038917544